MLLLATANFQLNLLCPLLSRWMQLPQAQLQTGNWICLYHVSSLNKWKSISKAFFFVCFELCSESFRKLTQPMSLLIWLAIAHVSGQSCYLWHGKFLCALCTIHNLTTASTGCKFYLGDIEIIFHCFIKPAHCLWASTGHSWNLRVNSVTAQLH